MHEKGWVIMAEHAALIQFPPASACLLNHQGTRVTQHNYLFGIRSGGIWTEQNGNWSLLVLSSGPSRWPAACQRLKAGGVSLKPGLGGGGVLIKVPESRRLRYDDRVKNLSPTVV